MDEMDPFAVHEILNASARLLHQNRPGEAVQKLLPVYKAMPDNVDVAINLGGAYILQRKWRKAIDVLEAASKLHPENAMVWTNLAAAYLGRLETSGPQHQKRAIAAYKRALEIDPKAPNVNYHLGLIYADGKKLAIAHDHFQRALEVNPMDRDAKRWLNRLKEAIAEEERTKERAKEENDKEMGETATGDGHTG